MVSEQRTVQLHMAIVYYQTLWWKWIRFIGKLSVNSMFTRFTKLFIYMYILLLLVKPADDSLQLFIIVLFFREITQR